MDVDCSTITYETPPSSAVLAAVEKAKAELTSIASNLTQETLERWVLDILYRLLFCPLLISRVELCGEEWGVELTKVENQNIPTVWQIIIGGVKNTFSPLHLDFLDTKLKLLTPAAPVCLRQI